MNLIRTGGSWSGHERNCCFINLGDSASKRFADGSAITGLDFLDDGRAVCSIDWDHDGDLDLWMSARTGPRLRFLRNDSRPPSMPQASQKSTAETGEARPSHFVAFRLRGTHSNRDAIGARVVLHVDGRPLMRSLHAGDAYLGQSTRWLHFGLGPSTEIESLEVRWPDGTRETFASPAVDHWYELIEGTGDIVEINRTRPPVALAAQTLETGAEQGLNRLELRDRVPLPRLQTIDLNGAAKSIPGTQPKPTLISLWATWCAPCLVELNELQESFSVLQNEGLDIVALNINGLGDNDDSTLEQARTYFQQRALPFQFARADRVVLDKLETLQDVLISLRPQRGQIPKSFLLDQAGRVAVIYTGKLDPQQLVEDVRSLSQNRRRESHAGFPFAGRWLSPPTGPAPVLVDLYEAFQKSGHEADANRYVLMAADIASRQKLEPQTVDKITSALVAAGNRNVSMGRFSDARKYLSEAVRLRPNRTDALANLGTTLWQLKQLEPARNYLERAIRRNPGQFEPRLSLGIILLELNEPESSRAQLEVARQINPQAAVAHQYYGLALARLNRTNEAIQSLRIANQLAPQDASIQQDLANLLKGSQP